MRFSSYLGMINVSNAPSYATDILQKNTSHSCNTRSISNTMPLLNISAHSEAPLGDRSFSFASIPSVPHHSHLFKSCLKMCQFTNSYMDCCMHVYPLAILMIFCQFSLCKKKMLKCV